MRSRTKRACIRFVSAVICLSVVISNSGAVVLCVSEDGHIAIETAGSNCCTAPLQDTAEKAATAFHDGDQPADGDDCGSCVDIPISGGVAGTFNIAKKASPVFLASTLARSLAVSDHHLSALKLALKSFEPTPFFTPLSTVVLLT